MKLRKSAVAFAAGAATLLLFAGPVMAQDATPKLDTGDTAWMLTSTALVLMMTIPGLALFYGARRMSSRPLCNRSRPRV
jgi:Amt family ammonium transporter